MGLRRRAVDDSRLAGRQLAELLANGEQLGPRPVAAALVPGEVPYGEFRAVQCFWSTRDVGYTPRGGGYRSGSALAQAYNVALFAMHTVHNLVQRAQAGAESRPQWRPTEEVDCIVTDRRLVLQTPRRSHDLWYDELDLLDSLGEALVVQGLTGPAVALRTDQADYWFVVLQWLAHGLVVVPPPPDRDRPQGAR